MDERDIWIIDRNKSEDSMRSTRSAIVVRCPDLSPGQSDKLKKLEFGSELDFFREHGAKNLRRRTVDGIKCKVFVSIDNRKVTLFMKPDNLPLQIEVQSPDVKYAVRFLKYDPNQKPDMNLFKVPPGTKIIDP